MTMTDANGALPRRTTNSTKPRNTTAGTAGKRITRGGNCTKHGNAAGMSGIAGGMKTAIVGIPIAIGMTTITIVTKPSQLALEKRNGAPRTKPERPVLVLP